VDDGSGKFLFFGLPLGGRYRITVKAGSRVAKSEEIVVDDKHPIEEITLRLSP
jgi:hypothetical protein